MNASVALSAVLLIPLAAAAVLALLSAYRPASLINVVALVIPIAALLSVLAVLLLPAAASAVVPVTIQSDEQDGECAVGLATLALLRPARRTALGGRHDPPAVRLGRRFGFRLAAKEPRDSERIVAARFVQQSRNASDAWAALFQALFASADFRYVH